MRRLAGEVAAPLLVLVLLAGGAPRALADTNLAVGGLAIVANTAGEPIVVRDGAGYEYTVIASVGEGDILPVLDGPIEGADGNDWYQVDVNGTDGFVFAAFLVLPENAPARAARATQPITTNRGYSTTVSGTGGEGARLRDGAELDAAIVLVVPEAATVDVVGESRSGDRISWYPVAYAGEIGWMAGDFLGSGAQVRPATTAPPPQPTPPPVFERGAHVTVSGTGGDDLRIRETYGLDGAIYGYASADAVIRVLDGPLVDRAGNAWYAVDYDGLSGYASATYLGWSSQALSKRPVAPPPARPATGPAARAPSPTPSVSSPPAPADSGTGQAIVNMAMKYQGYLYAWGGASPSGFDCSGFTRYVVSKALGRSLSHSTDVQIGAGRAVSAGDLQPGDLVFFQNTYKPGLSHVGIYIGGGQMISAASERTGVAIANIWDSYWGPRYYAARRL